MRYCGDQPCDGWIDPNINMLYMAGECPYPDYYSRCKHAGEIQRYQKYRTLQLCSYCAKEYDFAHT